MKSIFRFHLRNKNQQPPIAEFLLIGTVIAFGIFLIVPSGIPAHGLHKETSLVKKYDNLQNLVNHISNGKVDFKEFWHRGSIDLAVMKDSETYDEANTGTNDCIDFAGKVGNSLADREIVEGLEYTNYFKDKFSSNTGVSEGLTESPSIGKTVTKSGEDTISSSANSPNDKNDMVENLVKTGQFTVEAKEHGSKMKQGGNQKISTADDVSTMASNTNTSAEGVTMSTNTEANKDGSSTTQHDADEYNDLGLLVDDIRKGDLDADRISLKDFQNSEAYKGADEQSQACIDLAGKVGNNLADKEIVHCSEDTNYFKNKYSLGGGGNVDASSTTSHRVGTSNATTGTNESTQTNSTPSSSQTRSTSSADNIEKNILIDEIVKTGKFTESEAIEFAIISELVNKYSLTEKDAIYFAKKIMQSRSQTASLANGLPAVTTTPNTEANADELSTRSNIKNITRKASPTTNLNNNDKPAGSKADNAEGYKDLGQLVRDIQNGDLDADRISLKVFQNSEAYKGADEQTQACIDLAGKVGNNLGDNEIVHCSEDTNYFKNKFFN